MKRVIRSDKPMTLLLLLWSHKCDFSAEPRGRIIATLAVKGLRIFICQVRKQLLGSGKEESMRKKTKHWPGQQRVFIFYSPSLNLTRIWRLVIRTPVRCLCLQPNEESDLDSLRSGPVNRPSTTTPRQKAKRMYSPLDITVGTTPIMSGAGDGSGRSLFLFVCFCLCVGFFVLLLH
jgi:hypothetical protein